jgi:hypothetical protein
VLAAACVAVAGCGGTRQDANEPAATFQVRVVDASFPARQHIAQRTRMRIVVRNVGRRTVPDVAVTVHGFDRRLKRADLADASRASWIIDQGPRGGDTAYVSTWALGALAPGRTRTFEWMVTPTFAGKHDVTYEVAAGLAGKARVQLEAGHPPGGSFKVDVSSRPATATVDPTTGAVIRR